MSKPKIGQIVWWYPQGDTNQTPLAAVVTRVGFDSLNLNIFAPNSVNMLIRDGVRHKSDPRSRSDDMRESGCWEYPECEPKPEEPKIKEFEDERKIVRSERVAK